MLDWKTLNSMPLAKYCRGAVLSARVYADAKGNKCPCGGLFAKRIPHSDEKAILMPYCDSCGERPSFYVIDADVKDANGARAKARIRNTKDSKRLDSPTRVAYIFNVIQEEILAGTFNIRQYDSEKSKQAFIFKNYAEEYLKGQRLRLEQKEITPKGFLDKERLVLKELVPYFSKVELFKITPGLIRKFRDQPLYKEKPRTRDLALGELKALLNQAKRDELLVVVPGFDKIPRAKKRENIISRELAFKTAEAIEKEVYRDMYILLITYPVRPGELRALMWNNVDFTNGKFTICQHFSDGVLIEGRKSVKLDKKQGSITFDMSPKAREIFRKHRSADVVSLNSFVFLGERGGAVTESCLWHAWNNARTTLGHKFAPYECRHVAASELYRRTGNDIIATKEIGGWTNTATLERYVADQKEHAGLFD
jgi:integrase